jgi:preprotein translocase subunit SecB
MLRAGHAPATRPLDRRPLGATIMPPRFERRHDMAADAGTADPIDLASNGNDSLPQVGVLAQYVKDLSFENPNAPAVYQWQGQPQMDVQFNIGTQNVGQDVHEVVLKVEIEAKGNEGVAFRIELLYAGLFALRNIPTDQLQPFLLAEAPRLLFPFARRVIADASIDGGFPPLLLDPIDFAGLYMQSAAQQGGESGGGVIPDETGQA